MPLRSPRRSLPSAATLAVAAALLALLAPTLPGCSSTAFSREQARLENLNTSMRAAAAALNAADLAAAEQRLHEADRLARSDYEKRKVQSLRLVLAGAEALRGGSGTQAAEAWARIPNPTLRLEVQEKAAGVGIQVPDRPTR